MSRAIEERIAEAAARQYGIVTHGQLVAVGLSPAAVGRRLRGGRLRSLHRGVYLVGPLLPPNAAEMAAVLASGRDAVVSHASAARLWGLRSAGRDVSNGDPPAEPVDVIVVAANRGRRPGIRVHRVVRLENDERAVRDGIPLTAPGRTLIDLAGVVGTRELERAVARAEREALLTSAAVAALLRRYRGRPGARRLAEVLGTPGGAAFTRSKAEEAFLSLVRKAGLPAPEGNVPIGRYELDFLWRAHGIAVEVDGFRHHATRRRFEGDRRKDAWLLTAGIKVLRLSWRQITEEEVATAVQLGQALARA